MEKLEIRVNSVKGKIVDCPKYLNKILYKALSYQHPDYQFSNAYLSGVWDGYIRKFSKITNSFPSGLLYRIISRLKRLEVEYTINDLRGALEWDSSIVAKNLESFVYTPRPYQVDGLIKGLRNPYMVFWWATSSGKTVQFSLLISALRVFGNFRNTLILVANRDLAAQHREEMEKMLGVKIGLIEEGRFEPERITVAVINTLWHRSVKYKDKGVIKYLSKIDHLISDECHRIIESKMFKQTINKCNNTIARHGFSGSPFSLTVDDLELESVTGPPLSKVPMSELIEEGWVSRPHVYFIKYDGEWLSERGYQNAYKEKIVDSEVRNNLISNIAIDEFNDGQVVLILVRVIRHGKCLKDLLIEKGVDPSDVRYVHGSSSSEVRMKVKKMMRSGNARLVIASQIWNEGIDIPAIDVLIKADGGGGGSVQSGRGVRSVIQQVGRVVRKPVYSGDDDVNTEEENIVKIYDFNDNVHKDLANHSRNRYATYVMEKSFVVKSGSYEKIRSKKGDL